MLVYSAGLIMGTFFVTQDSQLNDRACLSFNLVQPRAVVLVERFIRLASWLIALNAATDL